MENLFALEGYVMVLVTLALLAVKIYAFVSAMLFPVEAYQAADKLTKPAWGAILGLGVAAHLILGGKPVGLVNLVFTIAAFVYLADVKPALAGLRRR